MDEQTRSRELLGRIAEQIKHSPDQRITFAHFMQVVLYDLAYGYYTSPGSKIGFGGADFYTSPNLSPTFGQLLAKQLAECWELLGLPTEFWLIEQGAGTGTMALAILDELKRSYSATYATTTYEIREISDDLKAQQEALLADHPVQFSDRLPSCEQLPVTGVYLTNELPDAFPVHRVVGGEGGTLLEEYVTLEDFSDLRSPELKLIAGPLSTPRLHHYFERLGITIPPGNRAEVNLAALDWIAEVARVLDSGYVITIDYGYPASKLYAPARTNGTLLGYYQHTVSDNPFAHLGSQDLTSHVDFTSLQLAGEAHGLQTLGLTNQAAFLLSLGLGDRVQALQTACLSNEEYLRQRAALLKLIEPGGLGSFGVLIQGKGIAANQPLSGLKFRI